MASIGEKSLVLFTVCLFLCFSESFEKFGLPPEKKLEENSGPDPLILVMFENNHYLDD
jgi:hypothetical protein